MPNVSSFGAQTDNAVVSGTVTDRQMIIPEVPPQGLMSVGPRVTPNFVKPREWNAQTTYHFFDAVRDAAGNAYVATKPVIPAGAPLTNEDYWFLWADPDTRFDDLNETVKTFNQRITQNTNDIATKAPINHASEETIYGIGNELNYGHVQLATDDTPLTSDANAGVAATPNMIFNTLKKGTGLKAFGAVEGEDATTQIAEMIKTVGYAILDGDYLIGHLKITDPIVIIGNGHKLTCIKNNEICIQGASISDQKNNRLIYLENCEFDGGMSSTNAASYTKMAISSNRCDNVVIKNCAFKNFAEDAVYIGGVQTAEITGNIFENIGTWLYQSTRNGFSCFSWSLLANGTSKSGKAGSLISIENNVFKDITDEGFRIDDFNVANITNNYFENIGMYAMEPTYDVTFDTSGKVFNARNNIIDSTGSTAISFDFLTHYDQSARDNFKVTIESNVFKNIAKSNRYMKDENPLPIKLHIICNLYITKGMNEMSLINNSISIDGFTPHDIAHFGNYLTYVSQCTNYIFSKNTVNIINNSQEKFASYMCLVSPSAGRYTITENEFNVTGSIYTIIKADSCNVDMRGNNIQGKMQYVAFFNGSKTAIVSENNIECESIQHLFLAQNIVNYLMENNVIKHTNNASNHIINDILGSVANTNFICANNIVNKAANIAYPTSGYNAHLIENNI